MTEAKPATAIYLTTAIKAWESWQGRANRLFDSLSDEEMLAEIAPGKNRPVYLLGHLTAVHDSIVPQLRLGEASYLHFRELFIDNPDRAVEIPAISDLRQAWKEVGDTLSRLFHTLSAEEWLERHALVSEEDFQLDPYRNRFGILLSRTSHLSYHVGQLMLRAKA